MDRDDSKPTRAAFRFRLPCSVEFKVGQGRGRAFLLDISTDGVRVEEADHRLEAGQVTSLILNLAEDAEPVEVEIEVVRQTETGFAGRFVNLDRTVAFQLWDSIVAALKSHMEEEAGTGVI